MQCSFVCLSVSVQDYSKTRSWIWMKCCASTDVGTWKNWLTFEPDLDHSRDAETGFLSPIAYALQQCNLLRRGKSYAHTGIGGTVEAATRGFEASKDSCRGKCSLPSALLVGTVNSRPSVWCTYLLACLTVYRFCWRHYLAIWLLSALIIIVASVQNADGAPRQYRLCWAPPVPSRPVCVWLFELYTASWQKNRLYV